MGISTRWLGLSSFSSISWAFRLVVSAPTGSALHMGAPTRAASGMTMSALAVSLRIRASSRQSPLITWKLASAQQWFSELCLNMKLSSTVTL